MWQEVNHFFIHTDLANDDVLIHDHAYGSMSILNPVIMSGNIGMGYQVVPFDYQGLYDNVYFQAPPVSSLMCNVNGRYKGDWHVSFRAESEDPPGPAMVSIYWGVFINGAPAVEGQDYTQTIYTEWDSADGTFIINCNQNDQVDLRAWLTSAGTATIYIPFADFNMLRVGNQTGW
jgi:hypothetical protein